MPAPPNANEKPPFSIARALAAIEDEHCRAACHAHLQELQGCLSAMSSYTVRDDSRLAFRYATGQLAAPPWSAWTVAHEMACMQHLCDQTAYAQGLPDFLRALADRLRRESGVGWACTWAAVADLGPDLFKLSEMERMNVVLPDFAPDAAPVG